MKTRAQPKPEGSPTRERLRHAGRGGFHIGGDQRSTRVYRMCDAPIERARAAGQLSEDQFEALQRLWVNWHFGQLDGGLHTIDLDRVSCGVMGEPANGGLRAAKFHAAWQRLEPEQRDIVGLVVLAEYSLKHAGQLLLGFRSPCRAKEAALQALQAAADQLCWRRARQA
jgi:hypothetical protein